MKKQLIIGSFLALSGIASAQPWATSGSNIYNTNSGNVGIGTTSPVDNLEVKTSSTNGGIFITQTGSTNSSLKLNNMDIGGHRYDLCSTGSGNGAAGNFSIYDYTSATDRFFIQGLTGNTGMGTISPLAKLHVVQNNVAYYIALRGSAVGVGVEGEADASTVFGTNAYGILGSAKGGSQYNFGGKFTAQGGASGVYSYGVHSQIDYPTLGGYNYGIYASVKGNGNSGTGPNWAGYFDGDVYTTTGYYGSDKRIKKNIQSITNSLNIISKLNPVHYNFDIESNPDLNLSGEKQYGFISQEVKEILPELTKMAVHPAKLDDNGKEIYPSKEILSLNYNGFIAILAKGIQEQQQQITDLQNQVAALTNKTGNATGINQLSNTADGFALEQNVPNPFSQETVIKYTLPQQFNNASMLVYDLSGKQIASFPITEKGSSSMTITSEKLSAGIYIYSVIADGKILDSKRMVVAQKQ